jgi:hypothetical protein
MNDKIEINKFWGGLISGLVAVLISVLGYIYINDKKIQEKKWEEDKQFKQEIRTYMRAQNIWNLILLDLIAENHPDVKVKDRAFQIWGQYENMNTRGGRNE